MRKVGSGGSQKKGRDMRGGLLEAVKKIDAELYIFNGLGVDALTKNIGPVIAGSRVYQGYLPNIYRAFVKRK
jgi:hypothetical protein